MSLTVTDITKMYGHHKVLHEVSFSLKPGEIVGFLGPNGAGKTTTLKIITGYLSPSSGQVWVDGQDVSIRPRAVKRIIGYLSEHNPLYWDMYVGEFLRFIGRFYGLSGRSLTHRVDDIISSCALDAVRHKQISTLSKGYKQRVGLAQALIHHPEVLILDEPTSGLDPNQILEIRNVIKKISDQKTVLFSSHSMSEVESMCNRVIILHAGKIVADDTLEALTQSGHRTLEEVFHQITGGHS